MLRYTRRNLVTGSLALGASTLAAPAIASLAPRRAHVVTAVDWSVSTGPFKVRAEGKVEVHPATYDMNIRAFASVLVNHLGRDMEDSRFDEVEFEAFRWAQNIYPLLPRRILKVGNCQPELVAMAEELLATEKTESDEGTFMSNGLQHILTLFDRKSDKDVANVATDDNASREAGTTLSFYKPLALNMGLTTNGFIWGDPMALNEYFEHYVRTGGPESFVLRSQTEDAVRANWRRKFVLDLY